MHIRFVLCLAGILTISVGALSQRDDISHAGMGTVEGTVVDQESKTPIAEATVIAEPDDGGSEAKLSKTQTDERGNFSLRVPAGAYVIAAAKQEANYPNTDIAAFATDLSYLPKISLHEGEIRSGVVIPLNKGGTLDGLIIDSRTQQPVLSARIRLTRVDHPNFWTETGPDIHGSFHFVLPFSPFTFTVAAQGYETWTFGEGRSGTETVLQLNPATPHRQLEIGLVKKGSAER
jgi:hypothetical protein